MRHLLRLSAADQLHTRHAILRAAQAGCVLLGQLKIKAHMPLFLKRKSNPSRNEKFDLVDSPSHLVMGCSWASRWRRGKLSTSDRMAGPAAGCRRIAPISLDSMSCENAKVSGCRQDIGCRYALKPALSRCKAWTLQAIPFTTSDSMSAAAMHTGPGERQAVYKLQEMHASSCSRARPRSSILNSSSGDSALPNWRSGC